MMIGRREFLAGSALAASAPALAAATPSPDGFEAYPIGDFILQRLNRRLRVSQRSEPDRLLWEGAIDGEFLTAEEATADIRAFGTPEGAYSITDTGVTAYNQPSIDAIEHAGRSAIVSGKLRATDAEIGYTLTFEAVSAIHLRFEVKTDSPSVNRIRLRSASVGDEAFFGFGQQLTDFNQKGNLLPILVQEHGVGRGRPVVTELVDLFANHGGGNPHITEAPAPHFISSRLRSLFLENTEYSLFDLRPADRFEIKVWSGVLTGRILFGQSRSRTSRDCLPRPRSVRRSCSGLRWQDRQKQTRRAIDGVDARLADRDVREAENRRRLALFVRRGQNKA
jgi:alpha-glucosidase